MRDEESELMGISIRWWGLFVALAIGTVFVFRAVEPSRQDMETNGQRRSLQYITSHQSALRSLFSQYRDASLSLPQRRAIYMQMQYEADLIPGRVPQDIQSELSRGPE